MNESDYIDLIVQYMQDLGFTVNLYAHNLHYGGRYDHRSKTIWINDPEARSALMTLAHEVGHAVGWRMHNHVAKRKQLHRERQAYVYGWQVLKLFGADSLISRQEWIESCKESHRAFLKSEAKS